MMRSMVVCALVIVAALLMPAARGVELSLVPTKDARILGHEQERDQNGGTSTRLRAVGIDRGSAEFIIMDFDRAALKAFLEKNKDKKLSGKLVLTLRWVQGADAKLEVATIDCGVDWNEGARSQVKAEKGECCALWAQAEEKKWTTPDGKEVAQFKDMVYDSAKKEVKTVLNSKGADLKHGTEQDAAALPPVEIELDEALIKHLGTSENCRGLFLFHRDKTAKVDIFSREQSRKGPKLIVKAE